MRTISCIYLSTALFAVPFVANSNRKFKAGGNMVQYFIASNLKTQTHKKFRKVCLRGIFLSSWVGRYNLMKEKVKKRESRP